MSVLIFLVRRFAHHSSSSGYDHLTRLFPGTGQLSQEALEQGRLLWLQAPACLPTAPSSLEELVDVTQGHIIFHVLHGDLSAISLQLRALARNASIIVTLHQPAWLLKDYHPDLAALDSVDLLLAVSEDQAAGIRALGVRAPIVVAKLGIWTEAFRPRRPRQTDGTVLVVGEHLRDWRFLRQAIPILVNDWQLTCRLVIPFRQHAWFRPERGLHLESKLPEKDLIERYQSASLLLLPVVSTTGNISVLEAMASGCPVVCNRLRAFEEYLGDAACYFPTGDLEACIATVLAVCRDRALQNRLSTALIGRSLEYDWSKLALQYASLYARYQT